ncbi:hypothetical protein J2Z76_002698 [Sedimentibacter acidaminivorans]|uniref:Apea-like HEPN domain-containing protein n=1 Tax=Sedimentibacter acidaminivorans TaxID=913099 RepID=A0ABS4GGJ9_9FIRM|nr:hypothetical protein [Sedimentibacter acidaminivorans]MBP1926828.1 hypothetical protein [Sedimentibacter acidaminivorans]
MCDIDKIIEEIISDLKIDISEQLQFELSKIISFKPACLKNIISIDEFETSLKDIIIRIFNSNPFIVMNEILSCVKEKNIIKEIDNIYTMEEDLQKDLLTIQDSINLEEFSIITKVYEPEVYEKTFEDNENYIDYIKYNINYIDYYEKKLVLDGVLNNYLLNIYDAENSGLILKCDVRGVLKDENMMPFLEYILDACVNITYKNNKMAFFNLFAAIDSYIELLYEKVFSFYIENYTYYIENVKDCVEEFYEFLNEGDKGKIISEVNEFLKRKIKYFSNNSRRLINEKLKPIIKELDPTKEIYFEFDNIISYLLKAEKIRNTIAHGGRNIQNYNVGELFYNVLSLIFSITTSDDACLSNWSKVLCRAYYCSDSNYKCFEISE